MPSARNTPQRAASGGRFARPTATPGRRSTAKPRTTESRRMLVVGRTPQKSAQARALESVTSMLPGTGAKKRRGATGGGAKAPAGFALVAGAARLAYKNRDKLTSVLRRRRDQDEPATAEIAGDRAPTDTPPADRPGAPTTS